MHKNLVLGQIQDMMRKTLLVVLLTCSVLQLFSQARQFKVGDERRRYLVYLPASYHRNTDQKYPVVFNFHGGGMTMTEQMFYSGMNKSADKYGFIVVYPQGVNQDWNVGFETSYQFGKDDVGYIDKLLAYLTTQYRINEAAVYATGLSRGGFFCHRLAAELPDKFAAIATVGAPLPDSVIAFHTKKNQIPVMIIHGTSDQIVNYQGKAGAYQSAVATYEYWKKHNGLNNIKETFGTVDRVRNDSTSVTTMQVSGNGIAVSLVTISGGGHTLPGADPFNIGFPLGKTSMEINNNDLIWGFFKRFKRAK